MASLEGRTIFMSGGSRGIGRAIALRAAKDGANVVIAAKTDEPHEKLPGTIHTVAEEIREAGGQALPLKVDIRDEDRVAEAVGEAVAEFGGIDVVVNNASAIRLTGTEQTPVKRYDLLHQINGRGTYVITQACIPHLEDSDNPHVLTLAPPLDLARKWFAPFPPYVITKFTMSLFTHAWAGEYGGEISFNALWPRTAIKTAAVEFEIDAEMLKHSRQPQIMADAAHVDPDPAQGRAQRPVPHRRRGPHGDGQRRHGRLRRRAWPAAGGGLHGGADPGDDGDG